MSAGEGVSWRAFGWKVVDLVPGKFDWHANVLTGARVTGGDRPWWEVPDFESGAGDIKTVWEASRFPWLLPLAVGAAAGSEDDLALAEVLLRDWVEANPPYRGPNWKCGQEASIRVLQLAAAARLLGLVDRPPEGLLDLLRVHCRRIEPTLLYAMGQDNNHGTLEAAAMFVGGSWLQKVLNDSDGGRWFRKGRKWLEDRVARLIASDGSFSQHSVNYHRLMLDTLCFVELWRRELGLPEFSATFTERAAAATQWLHAFVLRESGDAPNLGANDGAWLWALPVLAYRDFRPSVQFASVLFCNAYAYGEPGGPAWAYVNLFGLEHPTVRDLPRPGSEVYPEGGYAVLRAGNAVAYVRYPRFRFRPSHADALHLDFWIRGENWLRDAGTFSYNSEPKWLSYFSGTESHNTVQFDDMDQMPRIGRFLFGDWLEPLEVSPIQEEGGQVSFAAAYKDRHGHRHRREVVLGTNRLLVRDEVEGFRERAVLRWRLKPGSWREENIGLRLGSLRISVCSEVGLQVRVVKGWESRFYLQKSELPVLEVEIKAPGRIDTLVEWD
ncbi:MAG: hypothetical protein Kow0054_01900 [Deferrisoma sp.]